MQSLSGSGKPPSPRAQLPKRFIPTYYGDNNAVAIQLFCIDEKYEMRYVLKPVWCVAIKSRGGSSLASC